MAAERAKAVLPALPIAAALLVPMSDPHVKQHEAARPMDKTTPPVRPMRHCKDSNTPNKTKIIPAILVVTALAVSPPGIGEAFAAKTYAVYWWDKPGDYYGVSAYYETDNRIRDGWLADVTWFQTYSISDMLEIGWIDKSGNHPVEYYCAYQGNISEVWGAPSDGTGSTYYIYDNGNDGSFDLIGDGDYCQFDIGSYSLMRVMAGYEDSKDSNFIENNLHKNLKYYDGSWHNWSSSGSRGVHEDHSTAEVDLCNTYNQAEIGDTANC